MKRAAMGGVSVAVHFMTELTIERYFGEHNTWEAAWNAGDVDWWEATVAFAEGAAAGDSKYVTIGLGVINQVVEYWLETPSEQLTWAGGFTSAATGAINGVIDVYADNLVESFTKRLNKYGPEIVTKSLDQFNVKPLIL